MAREGSRNENPAVGGRKVLVCKEALSLEWKSNWWCKRGERKDMMCVRLDEWMRVIGTRLTDCNTEFILEMLTSTIVVNTYSWMYGPRVAPGQSSHPSHPFTSPPSTLSFSIFYCTYLCLFPLSFFYSLHLFSCLFIPSHSSRIMPLHF